MNNAIKKIILIASLALWPSFILADQNPPAAPLQSAVDSLNATVDKLIDLKDNFATGTLSERELEKQSKIDAFENIIKLSFAEIGDLRDKLNSIPAEALNDETSAIKDKLSDDLDNYDFYYKNIEDELRNDLAPSDIKSMASDLKNWRVNYEANLEKIFDFVSVFQGESLLTTAKERWGKISEDVVKIRKSGLPTARLQILLGKAKTTLDEASKSNNQAKDNLLGEWKPYFLASSTNNGGLDGASNSAISALETKKSDSKDLPDLSTTRINLQASLLNIRSAYQIFFEMHNIVKTLVQS